MPGNNMRGVRKRILPHCPNSSDFEGETVIEEITNIFRAVEVVKQNIMDAGRNHDRSMQIRRDVDEAFCVYQHMYEDVKKEKTVQSTLLKCFERQ
jgi:hypothetical protein